jgi:hypothetical protein
MVYTPTGQPFTIDISGLKGRDLAASWLSPLDGESVPLDTIVESGTVEFEPPAADDHPDWVLVLEERSHKCRH